MKRFIYILCICTFFQSQARCSNDGWWLLGAAGAALTSCAVGGLLGKHLSDKHTDYKRRSDITNLEQQMYRVRDRYRSIITCTAQLHVQDCAEVIYNSGESVEHYMRQLSDDTEQLRNLQVRCASYSLAHHDQVVREVARSYQSMECALHALLHDLECTLHVLSTQNNALKCIYKQKECCFMMRRMAQKYASQLHVYAQETRDMYNLAHRLCSSVQAGSLCASERYPLLTYVNDLSNDCKRLEDFRSYMHNGNSSSFTSYSDLLYSLQDILKFVSECNQYRQQKQQKYSDKLQEEHLAIEQERLQTEREKVRIERERLCVEQEKVEQAYRMERSINRVRSRLNRLLERLDDDDLYSEVHEIVIEL